MTRRAREVGSVTPIAKSGSSPDETDGADGLV